MLKCSLIILSCIVIYNVSCANQNLRNSNKFFPQLAGEILKSSATNLINPADLNAFNPNSPNSILNQNNLINSISNQISSYPNLNTQEIKNNPILEYQRKYQTLPPLEPPGEAENEEKKPEDQEDEENQDNKTALPVNTVLNQETTKNLHNVIAQQQKQLNSIREEIKLLLNELKEEKKRIDAEKFQAEHEKRKGVHLDILFPKLDTDISPEDSLEEAKKKEAHKNAVNEMLRVKGKIPTFVVKPDTLQDIERSSEQLIQQQMSHRSIIKHETMDPKEYQVLTPEERINDSIASIDKLEAAKAKIKYEKKLTSKKLANEA